MESIQRLDRRMTVLIVAHRLSTLRHCDAILRFENGMLVSQGSYDAVIGSVAHDLRDKVG
jgi:ATP-binding cassette, subfamily B, bacterial PglK